MIGHARTYTKYLKRYDKDLYCEQNSAGTFVVYRKARSYVPYQIEGKTVLVSTTIPQYVTCLTEDWTFQTPSVPWGIEPLLTRIKKMDQWRKDDALERVLEQNEKADRDRERRRSNEFRARAADARRDFARATSDIRTANMNHKY